MRSQSLRVRVSEGNQTRVDLTLPSQAAQYLSNFLPEKVRAKLAARSIDLERVSRDAVHRDFAAGDLFHFDDGPKHVRIWLE